MRIELLVAAALAALPAAAQPTVSAVLNNYSYSPGIAQGSIFTIFGTGLAGASSGLQALPLQATLDGVSVQISVGSVTTQALLYYVMPAQLAGVLPSATPIGTGQIIVTVNGQTSAPAPIYVITSDFGILQNPFPNPNYLGAAALDVSGNLVASTNAANPGDTISLWGTGAGPVSGDETGLQPVLNLANIPIEVDIGGIASTVTYHGRSTYPGLDQINVVIPDGAFGCNVSAVVLSGELVSNFAYVPIAAQGRTCSDNAGGVVWPPIVSLTGKLSYNAGDIEITRNVTVGPPQGGNNGVNGTQDQFSALFEQAYNTSTDQTITFFTNAPSFPSIGSCYGTPAFQPASQPTASSANVALPARAKAADAASGLPIFLNAGPYIDFSGPNGLVVVPYSSRLQDYSDSAGGTSSPLFLPAAGGTIVIANAPGGPDVGQFSVQIHAPPPLVWTNMKAIPPAIDRTKSLTISWTGGDPAGIVTISAGVSGANMYCVAAASAGQFTIPASALLALPPLALPIDGGAIPILAVSTEQSVAFSGPNLDTGFASVEFQNSLWVPFQ